MATQIIHTVGVGQDYTSLAAWEAAWGGATSGDLVGNDEAVIAEIVGNVDAVFPALDINGFTSSDATRNITIRAKAGQEIDFVTKTGAHLVNASSGSHGLVVRSPALLTIENVGISLGSGLITALWSGALAGQKVNNCLLHNNNSRLSDSNKWTLNNCLILPAAASNYTAGVPYNMVLNNCTLILKAGLGGWNGDIAIYGGSAYSTVVYNENAKASYDNYFGVNAKPNCAQNANGSAASVAINTVTTADFADYAGGDYRLAATSQLIGAGVGGVDIGFDQYAAGGGTSYSQIAQSAASSPATQLAILTSGFSVTSLNATSSATAQNAILSAGFSSVAISSSVNATAQTGQLIVGSNIAFSVTASNATANQTTQNAIASFGYSALSLNAASQIAPQLNALTVGFSANAQSATANITSQLNALTTGFSSIALNALSNPTSQTGQLITGSSVAFSVTALNTANVVATQTARLNAGFSATALSTLVNAQGNTAQLISGFSCVAQNAVSSVISQLCVLNGVGGAPVAVKIIGQSVTIVRTLSGAQTINQTISHVGRLS